MWWDKGQLLSHNRVMNFVISNRGGGKTFGCTRWAIDSYLKRGVQAVWVRRYATEVEAAKGKFFDAVREYYPDHDLTVDVVDGQTVGKIDGSTFIYFIPLSTSRQLKSNNFPFVDKIIFDEFIIEKGKQQYLKGEVEVFLDLFETVARMRDNVRAVLLANAVTIVNPYFLYFNVRPNPDKRFTVRGQICIEMFTDSDFIDAKRQTRFGQLIDGTRYASYSIDNAWLLDNPAFIEKRTPASTYMFAIDYNGQTYGYWIDYNAGLIFVSRKYDPDHPTHYCLQKSDHADNLLLIHSIRDSTLIKRMVYAFQIGAIRFEDQVIKNQFLEYIGLFVR